MRFSAAPLVALSAMLAAALLAAAGPARAEVGLTVYSTAKPAGFDARRFIAQQRMGQNPQYASQVPGFGVVKDQRLVEFDRGENTIPFRGVAEFIDPSTVSVVDLDRPNATEVLQQKFLFDLVSPEKLLEKYLDKEITVRVPIGDGQMEHLTGTLLSSNQGQLVLRTEDGLRMVQRGSAQVQLGELPGGLITEPTLQWTVNSRAAGERPVRLTYQSEGLTWMAAYNLLLNEDDTEADLSAWVTLLNLSGATYPDAKLKLIAGEVRRVQPDDRRYRMEMMQRQAARAAGGGAGFEEQPFFEYHLYTLPRRVTVEQNATQQIALFPTVTGIDVKKQLVFEGGGRYHHYSGGPQTNRGFKPSGDPQADVYIRFENEEANELGIPLPRGEVRVYKEAPSDGSLEFVGEDVIDHIPAQQTALIRIGQSFDVTGERTQTDFSVDNRANTMTETFRIELSNAKEDDQDVIVRETLYRWRNWEIVRSSEDYEKIDASTIEYDVEVPAEGSKTIEYTVRYTW